MACPRSAPVPRGSGLLVEPIREMKLNRSANGNEAGCRTEEVRVHIGIVPSNDRNRKIGPFKSEKSQLYNAQYLDNLQFSVGEAA